jgi:TerC family integral membrane protein
MPWPGPCSGSFWPSGSYFYLKVHHSAEFADLFLAGYILEKSLSVDNLMVFVAIFASFGIKGALQHRILYFGILGAVVFRMLFIAFGTGLFGISTWIEFVFAAIVAWTGWKMLAGVGGDDEIEDYSDHWSVRLTQKLVPIFPRLHGHHFVVSHGHVKTVVEQDSSVSVAREATVYATPMLLCLVCIEVSDIIFAFDSVPAVIAVTREPLLVYSAVIFAILGLRSLYFVLAAAQKYLVHLDKAVAALAVLHRLQAGAASVQPPVPLAGLGDFGQSQPDDHSRHARGGRDRLAAVPRKGRGRRGQRVTTGESRVSPGGALIPFSGNAGWTRWPAVRPVP